MLALLCQVQETIKIILTSLWKQLSRPCSNLDRCQSELGSILGGFWTSKSTKNPFKTDQNTIPKIIIKMMTFWMVSRSIFNRFQVPSWVPRGVTDLYIVEFFWILGLSWRQDVPKTPPRASRDLSRPPPGPIFEALGPQLDGFQIDFLWILDRSCTLSWLIFAAVGWLPSWLVAT